MAVLAYDYVHGQRVPRHAHRSHQLVYASTGAMAVHTDAGTFVVPPTRAVWVPGALAHAISMSGAVAMRTLYFSAELWVRSPKQCRVLAVDDLLEALIMTAISQRGLDRRRARDARLIAVLIDRLAVASALALHIPALEDARAERVAERVKARPGGRQSLHELARGVGASARTIERLFRAETGMSFGRWRTHVRLLHGMQRLAAGDKVTSAALEAGYAGASAFITAFRHTFGITPGNYLRSTNPT